MKISNSKNCLVLFGVFISVSLIRVLLNFNQYIINIIAVINITAFWYVIYLILGNAEKKFSEKLKNNKRIGEQIKIKKKKHFKRCLCVIRCVILVIGLCYSFIFANPIINDIIGIGALFLSIETDYIADVIQDKFYKMK